jgi:DNA-binding GntR family transcriptional regulator
VKATRTARIGRQRLSEEVATYLRDEIMSGELRPGQFIRLEEVAEVLGVSITPVREALLTLSSEDMVQLEARRGYVVAPLSRQDVDDLFRLQADLAGELAARAAVVITDDELDALNEVQHDLIKAVRADRADDIERLELEFHRIINAAAAARKLSWFLRAATHYTPARFYAQDHGWRSAMLDDHRSLIEALTRRDAPAVRTRTGRHFIDGAQRLIQHLDQLDFWA